jgi:hypothetical protein
VISALDATDEPGVPRTARPTASDEDISGPRYSPPNALAWFEQGTMQGSVHFLIVADIDVLHILRLEDSDGRCTQKRQGPFDICQESPWARFADVRMPIDRAPLDPPARFKITGREGAHDVGYIGDRAPIDCRFRPLL